MPNSASYPLQALTVSLLMETLLLTQADVAFWLLLLPDRLFKRSIQPISFRYLSEQRSPLHPASYSKVQDVGGGRWFPRLKAE